MQRSVDLCKVVRSVIGIVSVVTVSMCIHGCDEVPKKESAARLTARELHDLENNVAMKLPSDTILLSSGDGGGRDAQYNYYTWTIYSKSPINMPQIYTMGGNGPYRKADLPNSKRVIEVNCDITVADPVAAYSSEWENGSFQFRGLLVECDGGVFLHVERFSK